MLSFASFSVAPRVHGFYVRLDYPHDAVSGRLVVRSHSVTRDDYMSVGLEVLADRGHLGLKLAEVCRRLGVTSGSFYHYFVGWPQYRRELIEHWKAEATTAHVQWVSSEPDPRRRIAHLVSVALGLNHAAEAAMRAWSCVDPDVRAVQVDVDALRHDIVLKSAREIATDEVGAKRFADAALYLVIGYGQSTLAPDLDGLEAILLGLIGALHTTQEERR